MNGWRSQVGWSGLPRDTVQTSGDGSSVTLSGRLNVIPVQWWFSYKLSGS